VSTKTGNSGFICAHCGGQVAALTNGSYRNHCPHCLYSLHVDNLLGDRSNKCKGLMRPIGVVWHSKKGYQIVHQCEKCGVEKVNRIASDTEMPDDIEALSYLIKVAGR
jgi:hypothetical protein